MSTILVIDDDDAIRDFLGLALTKHGFKVIEASGGLAGVKLARTGLPDLILCDLNMDEVDGYSAISVLRLHPATASIPVILITGEADLEGMRRGMALGADDYLPKPIRIQDLLAAINMRLKKQQLIREAAEQKVEELRSNLLMMMPHELLTPLTGILGISYAMTNDAERLSTSEIKTFGECLEESGKRMQRLVQNFLTCMEIELIEKEPGKAAALQTEGRVEFAATLETLARKVAATHGRGGDLVLAVAPATVAISEHFLSKILTELIVNAFRFSKPGTSVEIRATVGDGALDVLIQDQGIGMTPEHIAKVSAFMQFERKLHEQQGLGLGLYIAKRLTEIHGGQLGIESEPGIGTTVFVGFPLKTG
jgi:signal transduction histidine kinase